VVHLKGDVKSDAGDSMYCVTATILSYPCSQALLSMHNLTLEPLLYSYIKTVCGDGEHARLSLSSHLDYAMSGRGECIAPVYTLQ
jgi:hypothetical protein